MHGLPAASIAVVLGTRPEIVKLAPIIELLGPAVRLIHTGQHFSEQLSDAFLAELALPQPSLELGIGGTSRGAQIGEATRLLDAHFAQEPPLAVVVQGDTNTVLAGALAANSREIFLVHVEAGLRSRDRRMPEEHNRVLTDHLADLCLAPTDVARQNLDAEGIIGARVVVTGNTVVDAVTRALPDGTGRAAVRARFGGLERGGYVLATFHRPENVDDLDTLRTILQEVGSLPLPVVLPLHPRAVARIEAFGLGDLLDRLTVIEPAGYRDFLALAADAAVLVSDSGGVQEEASVVKRPVVVVRRSTERPEVVGTFARLIPPGPRVSEQVRAWLADLDRVHAGLAATPSPYGEGDAAERSVAAIETALSASGA